MTRARSPKAWILGSRLLVVVFLLGLFAPWIDGLARPDKARSPELRENRPPAPKPELTLDPLALWKFPENYQSWFNDTLGLRDLLLRWHSLQSLECFGASPTSQVLLGREGWYFYTGDQSVPIWRGLLPLSERELERWRASLESRRDWLREQGIHYVFCIVPNKETVYPEFMPAALTQLGPTRLDQLQAYLARHSDLDLVDLRPAFAAARAEDTPGEHLYLEEGTHWNARGTMVAYRTLLEHLARIDSRLRPLPPEDWTKVPFDTSGDTWARKMYIEDLSPQRESGWMRPLGTARSRVLNEGRQGVFGPGRKLLCGTSDPSQPRAVLFHDSFGPYLENLLGEHFSTLDCRWTYDFDASDVREVKPDVVLELWVERTLFFHNPLPLTANAVEQPADAFQRATRVCLALDPTRLQPGLEAQGQTRLSTQVDEQGPALLVEQSSPKDTFLLPELECPPGARPLLHVEIDCPIEGNLDVLYLQPGDKDYSRAHNCMLSLRAGRNDVTVRMPEARVTGRLRVRPCFTPGGITRIRAFELRAQP